MKRVLTVMLCFTLALFMVSCNKTSTEEKTYIDKGVIREDVCELYLEVLQDLWDVDSGLNSGITQIGFDLSKLSHLTEDEKDFVMKEFASNHDLPYIEGTWEELCEKGYIDKENLYWEDGLLFTIKINFISFKLKQL